MPTAADASRARSDLSSDWGWHDYRTWLWAALLVVGTFVAYLPAVANGFIWDDQYYVTENVHLETLDGLRKLWLVRGAVAQYYPMVHTTLWLEYRFFGLDPTGYHVDNILLQCMNALLVWRLLLRLRIPGAWLAAAVFAIHPVAVETVAWIAERKNLLSTFFYLSAALVYFRFEPPESERKPGADLGLWAAAFLLFALAVLSKSVAFSLPAAILLVYWWKRGRVSWRAALPLMPFVLVGGLFGLQTAGMEEKFVGAVGRYWDLSGAERLLVAGRASWFYVGKLVWPMDLSFNYARWEIAATEARQWVAPVAALAALTIAWLARGRVGRGPLVAMLYFGGTLVPALGFIDVYPFMYAYVADHFQYQASLGPIALVVGGAVDFARRLPRAAAGTLAGVLAGLLLAVLGVLTWKQAHVYESPMTLWQDVLRKNPFSLLAHNNLGVLYQTEGDLPRAVFHARRVLKHHPGDEFGHFNLAQYLFEMGKLKTAERHYRKQLARMPDHLVARMNLGHVLVRLGRPRAAEREFQEERLLRRQLNDDPGPPDLVR